MASERSTRKHNLPAPASSFIGREQELREIGQRLGENRLITLTGTGGTGKTRLALQAATAERDHFSDGIWLVDLAPLAASELVLETIAKVLNLPDAPDPALIERLGAYLEPRHLLLVLDNCEHIIEECARIVAFLLTRCPRLMLLATSREPLLVSGEVVLRVPALSLPDEADPADRARFLHYDALRLFVERAQAASPSFRLTDGNAGVVAEICRQLDGLPLALELAARRIPEMGVVSLAYRLDQRFQLLTRGDRTALPRQQTLHATIDWGYRLLSGPEQVVLRRLGIFVGDFSLEAAESICLGAYLDQNGGESITPETILNHLLQLVNKSLVQFNQNTDRYRLLETIHLFCLERLIEAGEMPDLRLRHFAWYLQVAEHAAPNLSSSEQERWFMRLEAEHANLRAALGWVIDEGEAEAAARFALAMWRFWHTHTYQREGLRWLERILAQDAVTPLPPALRPRLLNALGVLCHSLRQFDRATSYHTEALWLWKALDDREGQAQALLDISWQQFDEKKVDQARTSAREGLALARVVGDRQAEARALLLGGLATTESGLVEEAVSALEESLVFFREMGDATNMALAMAALARAEGIRGNDERVKPLLREAVRLLVQLGNFIYLVSPLVALGFMAKHSEVQPEGAHFAAQVFGMLATWSEQLGGASPWAEGPLQQTIEQLTAMLGADTFAEAYEIGKQMTPADLVRLAEQITAPAQEIILSTPPRPAPAHSRLSAREVEVLHLVATGLTNAQIAHHLSVTPRTVNAHLTAIYRKLGVPTRSGAIRYALDHQLG
jgi:predicted ATPase/DNA-binding CsgD family transcriptional regulator